MPVRAIPPPPLPVKELETGELELVYPIVFVAGKEQMMTGSSVALHSLWGYLQGRPEVTLLRIEAHTTDEGDRTKGQVLSERRALAVARRLVTDFGVDCKRLLPVGFGSSRPLYESNTPQRRAYNARITAVIVALDGKPTSEQPANGGKVAGDPCAAP